HTGTPSRARRRAARHDDSQALCARGAAHLAQADRRRGAGAGGGEVHGAAAVRPPAGGLKPARHCDTIRAPMPIRSICIHGHFYQPPRENAWLEAVETQDSAHPYHDWNERITAECYAPNASSRILDERDRITKIVNNYTSISFNFGPTLLSWMEERAPDTYAAIIHADRVSQERFGHGSAIAQAYHHLIMPLASERDRRTQVRWGIRDFEKR